MLAAWVSSSHTYLVWSIQGICQLSKFIHSASQSGSFLLRYVSKKIPSAGSAQKQHTVQWDSYNLKEISKYAQRSAGMPNPAPTLKLRHLNPLPKLVAV